MRPTTYNLPSELTTKIDQVARDSERSRSYVVRKLLETALTTQQRVDALQAVADAGLEKSRPRPTPTTPRRDQR